MNGSTDAFAEAGVSPLCRAELASTRAGSGGFMAAILASAIVAVLNDVDSVVDGFKAGYEWARSD